MARTGFFERARERGSENDREGVDGTEVKKPLQPGTRKRYQYAARLWEEYAKTYGKDAVRDAYDMATLKDFMKKVALGVDGRDGDPKASLNTVVQMWKDFRADFRRAHDPIPRNTQLSITNFIKVVLQEKLELPLEKRVRRFATENHFAHFGQQLWGNDWHIYDRPGTRVEIWSEIQLYAFTSARVGEYIESTSRAGSGRGLYYRDMIFGIFQNEQGQAEFAVQLTKDAKGMTWTPSKRPEHALHEGLEQRPLLLNPILPLLAMCIARGAFRDFNTIDEVLAAPAPPPKEMYKLQWRSNILNTPFYSSSNGQMQKADLFSRRIKELGRRAGYACPPTVHDFRAEGLHLVDQLYSTAQRMKHGGHTSEATFVDHYQPNNVTDGQNSYLGGQVRTIVGDLFRGMSLTRNPDLWQRLPAEQRASLESQTEFLAIDSQLEQLRGVPDVTESERRRLHSEKRKLVSKELRQRQKGQAVLPWTASQEVEHHIMDPHRSHFARVRRMMPERQRLAKSMSVVASLRSEEGRGALQDLISLCEQTTEVAFRPGLEPEKCHCSAHKTGSKVESGIESKPLPLDWKHVYSCHRAFLEKENVIAELCFLCDTWITGQEAWEAHCHAHLRSTGQLPVACDPLVYGGTLAAAGYCPVCLSNARLPASRRLYQYLKRGPWMAHVSACVGSMADPGQCPHPSCPGQFESALKCQYHLQDVHSVAFSKGAKRNRGDMDNALKEEEEGKEPRTIKRRCVRRQPHPKIKEGGDPTMEYRFIPQTFGLFTSSTRDRTADDLRSNTSYKRSASTASLESLPDFWSDAPGRCPSDTDTAATSASPGTPQVIDPRLLAADLEVIDDCM